jgi:phosphomannomutase/phosphoglucomutase
MPEGEPYTLIQALQKNSNSDQFKGATAIITIDGVRVEYEDGFGLARASNTTPVIVFRFEAESVEALARIQNDFRTQLLALNPSLNFPF